LRVASSDREALEELPIEEEAGCMPDMPCASIQEATSMQCTNGAEDIEEVRPGDMGPSGMIAGAGGLGDLVDEARLVYSPTGPSGRQAREGGPGVKDDLGVVEASAWSPTLELVYPFDAPPTPPPPAGTGQRGLAAPSSLVPSFPKTYSRRRATPAVPAPTQQQGSTGAVAAQTPPNKHSSFITKLSKKTSRILPTPRKNRIRQRNRIPGAPPRRSRRLAGVEPKNVGAASSTRSKKKVMRALDLIGESEGITPEALDEYGKLFTPSCSLVSSQSQALAAQFGWTVPDEDELEQEDF